MCFCQRKGKVGRRGWHPCFHEPLATNVSDRLCIFPRRGRGGSFPRASRWGSRSAVLSRLLRKGTQAQGVRPKKKWLETGQGRTKGRSKLLVLTSQLHIRHALPKGLVLGPRESTHRPCQREVIAERVAFYQFVTILLIIVFHSLFIMFFVALTRGSGEAKSQVSANHLLLMRWLIR